MSDATRRDAWREANSATTVTGKRTGGEPPREGIHEDHVHTPTEATHPANAAPDAWHPDDPASVGLYGHPRESAAREANLLFTRARYGQGKSTEDAVAAVKAKTGLIVGGVGGVTEVEAWEAEHPEEVATMREQWEAIVAAENEPATTEEAAS